MRTSGKRRQNCGGKTSGMTKWQIPHIFYDNFGWTCDKVTIKGCRISDKMLLKCIKRRRSTEEKEKGRQGRKRKTRKGKSKKETNLPVQSATVHTAVHSLFPTSSSPLKVPCLSPFPRFLPQIKGSGEKKEIRIHNSLPKVYQPFFHSEFEFSLLFYIQYSTQSFFLLCIQTR